MAENAYRAGPRSWAPGDEVLHRSWGWYIALGVILVALGVFALGATVVTTLISVLVFGWALMIGGVLQAGHALWRRKWSGFFLDLATGVLYFVVGLMTVTHPVSSAAALTLMIATFLVISGLFRVIVTASRRDPGWGWRMAHGIVSMVLGGIIWAQWPYSSAWVLGIFIGIDMIVNGVAMMMLGLGARRLLHLREPREPTLPPERPRREPLTEAPAH